MRFSRGEFTICLYLRGESADPSQEVSGELQPGLGRGTRRIEFQIAGGKWDESGCGEQQRRGGRRGTNGAPPRSQTERRWIPQNQTRDPNHVRPLLLHRTRMGHGLHRRPPHLFPRRRSGPVRSHPNHRRGNTPYHPNQLRSRGLHESTRHGTPIERILLGTHGAGIHTRGSNRARRSARFSRVAGTVAPVRGQEFTNVAARGILSGVDAAIAAGAR
mmetsp:Transcript_28828/g.35139  ORF Transcript_28828/g.35139 Transcript_28828/m.35139 type:complete len:217 (+) Transcript_28828:1150-1800(+)